MSVMAMLRQQSRHSRGRARIAQCLKVLTDCPPRSIITASTDRIVSPGGPPAERIRFFPGIVHLCFANLAPGEALQMTKNPIWKGLTLCAEAKDSPSL